MRWLVITWCVLVLVAGHAHAGPEDAGWSTLNIGLGTASPPHGGFADRMATPPCRDEGCPLGMRFVLGGGLGRWGVELHLVTSPLEDTQAMDPRDRHRSAVRLGPVVRHALARKFGFDLSVRGGLHYGWVLGETSTHFEPDPHCPLAREQTCPPVAITHRPDTYSLWALGLGATVQYRLRVEHGFFGAYADLDVTTARIGFPDGARTGVLSSRTFGIVMGRMFDLL
jgi:hypothetical protein